ncbi:MAG: heme o synthase [Gammaproteobacteria bacterium]|nr:heme o synthase [Gammaproteobacteria bacterium]
MSHSAKAIHGSGVVNPATLIKEYYELTKPKVVALIVFTALVGMFLATPDMVDWRVLVFGTLGIGLGAAAGAAVNQLVEQRSDALMSRTRRRPLPSGRVDGRDALLFSLFLAGLSMLVLVTQVNMLTAVLTFLSMIGYAIVYTLFLKRATPQNIVIGGAAGATPPVLGWAAVTGTVDGHALLLFLIIFTWTPPHFWALAIHRREDYAKADLPMLPVTHGNQFTRLHVLLYTILMVIVSILPYLTLMSGLLYLACAVLLGGVFLLYAVRLYREEDPSLPMKTFGYSIIYLMGLFSALLFDHYL